MITGPLFLGIIGLILFMLMLGIIGNIQYGFHFSQLRRSLQQYADREQDWEKGVPRHEGLNHIVENYRNHRLAGVEQINTQALIESQFHSQPIRVLGIFPIPVGGWERFLSFLSAGMVMIGLLGTFIGLTSALFGMQSVLIGFGSVGGSDPTVPQIIAAISEPFEGMSFAFLTSIFGIGASFLLTILSSGLLGNRIGTNPTTARAAFLTECEDFLDNRYLAFLETLKPKGSMDELMERLASKLKSSFDQSIAAFAESIVAMTGRINDSVAGIEQMLTKQAQIIHTFDQGSSQLIKFGQTMERTVHLLVENHKDTASQMDRLGTQVERLNEGIIQLGEKTTDSSRSLEVLIQSSTKMLEEERKNSEKVIHLFGERWHQIGSAQQSLVDQIQGLQRQMEESSRNISTQSQQVSQELIQRSKEQWDLFRREWQSQKENDVRQSQELQLQNVRHLEQVFQKMENSYQERNRAIFQNLQQTYGEFSRLIRQQEELGQKTMESHRFLVERLPALPRSAEEFARSVENLERLFADFLERSRREISSLLAQSQERERNKFGSNPDLTRDLREMTRELEAVRGLLEREFHQSHRFAYEIQQIVGAIYETGKSTIRRGDSKAIEGKSYSPRNEREYYENGYSRDEGMRR